jgi:hypothetical protein
MAAMFKSECGKESCLCTFLVGDVNLAKEWLQSLRQFWDAAKTSLRSINSRSFMPWTLSSLAEHEACFQQWCVLQLLVGVAATLAIFVLSIIWHATETHVQVSFTSIILNALMTFAMAFFATWIMWFGVIAKHGCCCAIACCCLGKPNILVVAVVEGLFALSSLISVLQALGNGHVLLILAALVACVHMVTQIYVTVEAFMVWLKSSANPVSDGQAAAVGAPVILGKGASAPAKAKGEEPQGGDVEAAKAVVVQANPDRQNKVEGEGDCVQNSEV